MKKKCGILLFILLLLFSSLSAGASSRPLHSDKYKNQLVKINGFIYFYNVNGNVVRKKWKNINGNRYYFNTSGKAATGLKKIDGVRYAFAANGKLQRSRFGRVQGKYFYVDSRGRVVTGWKTINGKRYYFGTNGIMYRSQWYTEAGNTYCFNKKGVMYTGWQYISGNRYYFNEDGVLQRNLWVGEHFVNQDGVYDPNIKQLNDLRDQIASAVSSYYGNWSVYVKNLDTNVSFSINNRSVYAASLIKLYAMGAVYDKINQGAISESSVSSFISNMITVSDNGCFNDIVRRVGISYVNTWCRANGYNGTNQGHGLSPAYNNYGLSNGSGSNVTSVEDCGRFLESVYRGTCVSPVYSQKMLDLLKRQERRWKIPAGIPSGVVVGNKTGETDDYTHDAAIVYSGGADYILVVMGEAPGSAWYHANKITEISRMVYNYFN